MSEPKYKRLVIKLDKPVSYDYCFCYIDIDTLNTSPDLDLSKVYLTLKGDTYKWRLSDIIGTKVNACGFSIDFEDSEKGKQLGLILGEEFYRTEISRVLKPKFFNRAVSGVTSLYDSDFYVYSVMIQNLSNTDVFIGDLMLQNIKIPSGGYINLNLYPNRVNLKDLYINSSNPVTVSVVVFY
jgi:hypothetical protein